MRLHRSPQVTERPEHHHVPGGSLFADIHILLLTVEVKVAFVTKRPPKYPSTCTKQEGLCTFQMNNQYLYRLCGFLSISKFDHCYQHCNFSSLTPAVSIVPNRTCTLKGKSKEHQRFWSQKKEQSLQNKGNCFRMQFLLWSSFSKRTAQFSWR